MLLFCSGLHAQENCNVEVKLLLSPTETQAATRALGSKQGSVGRVYFFDTIVRVGILVARAERLNLFPLGGRNLTVRSPRAP
jgi:hypothetical protein